MDQETFRRLAKQLQKNAQGAGGRPPNLRGLFAGGGLLVALAGGGLLLSQSLFNGV
jgi:prohibitin 2